MLQEVLSLHELCIRCLVVDTFLQEGALVMLFELLLLYRSVLGATLLFEVGVWGEVWSLCGQRPCCLDICAGLINLGGLLFGVDWLLECEKVVVLL